MEKILTKLAIEVDKNQRGSKDRRYVVNKTLKYISLLVLLEESVRTNIKNIYKEVQRKLIPQYKYYVQV